MSGAQIELTLRAVTGALSRWSYRFATEVQLHAGIAQALEHASIGFRREVRADRASRFDFLCDGGIVIEAKIDDTMPSAVRQVERYVQLEQCQAVVIAAAKPWADSCRKAFELNGKPVRIVRIRSQAF